MIFNGLETNPQVSASTTPMRLCCSTIVLRAADVLRECSLVTTVYLRVRSSRVERLIKKKLIKLNSLKNIVKRARSECVVCQEQYLQVGTSFVGQIVEQTYNRALVNDNRAG